MTSFLSMGSAQGCILQEEGKYGPTSVTPADTEAVVLFALIAPHPLTWKSLDSLCHCGLSLNHRAALVIILLVTFSQHLSLWNDSVRLLTFSHAYHDVLLWSTKQTKWIETFKLLLHKYNYLFTFRRHVILDFVLLVIVKKIYLVFICPHMWHTIQ